MLRLGVWVALALFVFAGCQAVEEPGTAGGLEGRRFHFRYETTVPCPPEGTRRLDVWVPLPLTDPGVQELSELRIWTSRGTVRQTTEPAYGNRMVHVRVDDPGGPTRVSWTAVITRCEDVGQGRLPTSGRFLGANALIPVDGLALTLAHRLKADDPSSPVGDRAEHIYKDVLASMTYDKKHQGWGRGSFEHATSICMGNCTDFHARFIGVGRAARIPCRFTMGIPMKPGRGAYDSYHCWAHWHDGEAWRPVDISEADKIVGHDPLGAGRFFGRLDPDRIALTVRRDIVLEPRQQGPPLNYFVFPYAEADGKDVEMGKKDWMFTWTDA